MRLKIKCHRYYCASPNKECGQANGAGYDSPYSLCRSATSSSAITYDLCIGTDAWTTGTCADAVFGDCGSVTCSSRSGYTASCGLTIDTNYICLGTDHCSTASATYPTDWWLRRYTDYKCTAGTGACTTDGSLDNGLGQALLCGNPSNRGYCRSSDVTCQLCQVYEYYSTISSMCYEPPGLREWACSSDAKCTGAPNLYCSSGRLKNDNTYNNPTKKGCCVKGEFFVPDITPPYANPSTGAQGTCTTDIDSGEKWPCTNPWACLDLTNSRVCYPVTPYQGGTINLMLNYKRY